VLELYGLCVSAVYYFPRTFALRFVFGDLRLINSETIGVIIYNGF
jgi:hypothetical protein